MLTDLFSIHLLISARACPQMVGRSLKNMLRHTLREVHRAHDTRSSEHASREQVVQFLNLASGSSPASAAWYDARLHCGLERDYMSHDVLLSLGGRATCLILCWLTSGRWRWSRMK
jgi:hypothetical protein